MTKSEYRKINKNIRNSISQELAINKSKLITEYLVNMDIIKDCKTIFVYLSYGREVSTDKIIKYFIDKGKTILVPKCNINTETMVPVEYANSSELIKGSYGINEPISEKEFAGDIDLVIVPGIAFDKYGNRIGHGKGYYDKFLNNKNICKLGLCYSENLSEHKLPCNNNDITMNYVVTDRGVLKIKV